MTKISAKEAIVIGLLINGGAKGGLDLVRESNGSLKRGTVYVLLERMVDKGLLESREQISSGRFLYRATDAGAEAYRNREVSDDEWWMGPAVVAMLAIGALLFICLAVFSVRCAWNLAG